MKLRNIFQALAVFVALTSAAFAADEYNVSSGLTAAGVPLALHGVDPVAFVATGNRIDGAARYTAVHDGAAYYFSNAENQTTFEADPEAYLPQNGGFCTFGVSKGKKFDGNPKWAARIDGKLYVFLNEEVFGLFLQDQPGTIDLAEENWPSIRSIAAKDL